MKNITSPLTVFFICCSLLLLGNNCLFANHIRGVDVTYQYISPNQYLVKLRLYSDCAGIAAPGTVDICYHSISNNTNSFITLNQSAAPFELPPNPYLPPVISACNGGTGFGIERYEYTGILSLPFASDDWVLSYTTPLPSPGPISNPNYSYNVSTRIDNINHPVNSSIQYVYDPVFQFCINQPAWDNLAATDPDGDSLHFILSSSLADSMLCPPDLFIPASPGIWDPPTSIIPLYMDPEDGWINFHPMQLQVAHITATVEEYRNGTLINESTISHQVIIITWCLFTDLADHTGTGFSIHPNPVNDKLTIENYSESIMIEIKIFTSHGQIAQLPIEKKQDPRSIIIDTNELNPGVYYISIRTSDAVVTRCFIKL